MATSYALPLHCLSIGDTILVYWDGDRKWYPAEITGARADHECEVLYRDGEREWIHLEKTKVILRRDREGSTRRKRVKKEDEQEVVEDEIYGIEQIRYVLFDIEDRLPLEAVCNGNQEWWKAWHDDINTIVGKNDIQGLMDAILSIALQLKPGVTTTWWAKHGDKWKQRLKNVKTTQDATLVLKDLQSNAINWSQARELFSVHYQRPDKSRDHSGRRLNVKIASPKTQKCSNSSVTPMLPSDTVSKMHMGACRRSNRLKNSTFEEKMTLKDTGELKNLEDNVASSLVVPSNLSLKKSEAWPHHSHFKKSNCSKNTNNVLKNHVTSKGRDVQLSTTDEPFHEGPSGDSATACSIQGSNGVSCLICQSGVAMSFLVQCRYSRCFCAFHIFCLWPPLRTIEQNWVCPICNGGASKRTLAGGKKQIAKRIRKIFGRKKIHRDDQKNVYQDQFLIKWESLSHHQDSWVPQEWLFFIDPLRIQRYLKKCLPLDESGLIDERKPEWFKIDRVIACREKCDSDKTCEIWNMCTGNRGNGEFEFLVKWMGLDYCESTWEYSCDEEFLGEVGKLIQRHQKAAERVNNFFISLDNEPHQNTPTDLYGDSLYDYQLQGVNWILSSFKARRNVILADEMGLGKTVQVICFIQCMREVKLNADPVLIIAPKSILFQWEKEFRHWAKDLNVIVYQGEKQSRKCIRTHEMYSSGKNVLFDVLITNYELVILDNSTLKKFKWSAIVIDEAHKIKRLDCKLASFLKQYNSDFRLLLTGTPLQNTLLELFSLLHFIDPEKFSDPVAEAESYKSIQKLSAFNIEKKIAEIHELLKPRMLRRMKCEVLPGSIPVKKWIEVPCALTDSQRELYIDILEKNYKKLNQDITVGRRVVLNFILMELRKCCNHPYLFPGQEVNLSSREAIYASLVSTSGKFQLLEKLLPRLKERGNRILLFSQMTKMLDILEDFLMSLGISYYRIDGSTPIAARQQQVKDFNDPKSQVLVFLISTRAGGLGIDLPTADRVIIYDPDFNPFMDLQAQSRAHRIGQTRPVVVYQLITKCSVEVKILEKCRKKLAVENMVMNPSRKLSVKDLHSVLLHGARTILSRKNTKATSINYDKAAIEALLKLDPAPDENCVPEVTGYLGGIQSFLHDDGDENDRPPASPKAEEWNTIFGAVDKDEKDLGRGKRQKKEIKYECVDSDNDEMYLPKRSSSASDSSDSSRDNSYSIADSHILGDP